MAYRLIQGYKKGQPDIGWWRRQIAEGLAFRKEMASEARWETWRKYYRGKFPPGVIPVNLYFKMIRTTVPRIYFRNPSISAQATKAGFEQQIFAQMIERIDNKLLRVMDVKGQMKRMIQNTWMFGTAGGKLGFGAEFTPTPDAFDTSAPEQLSSNFRRKVEWNQLVQANMPWFLSVHTRDLVVPKGLSSFEDTPWVAMRIVRSVDDVKADDRLSNTDELHGGSSVMQKNQVPQVSRLKENEIELWEIRDMRTGKVIVIPSWGCDKHFIYEDDALQLNGRPNIYPLQFNPDDDVFWGVPDSVILEPQQIELNEIRTLQMKHRRISLLKLLYKRGAIDPAEIEKLMDGDVGAAVAINSNSELTDIDMFQGGSIPEALFAADQIIQQDVRDMMGFSRNQSGEFAGTKSHSAPTAYEASIVNAASEIRVDERKDACADVLVKVFEDTNVLCFEKWTDEIVVQVMGPDSLPHWVAFKPAMLKAARYELAIDPDSVVPEGRDRRIQKADVMYQRLKDNPLIDPQLLTKYYLRENGGVALDGLMRTMMDQASQGVPGSAPDQPMDVNQLMALAMKSGGGA